MLYSILTCVVLLLSFSVDICQQPLNLGVGIPFIRLDYYYYNSTNNTCAWFNYLGNGGNDNKFDNISSCQERCGMFYMYYTLYIHCYSTLPTCIKQGLISNWINS